MAFLSARFSNVKKSGIREIFDISQSMTGVINLGIGEPDFKTPDFVTRAAKRSLDQGFSKYTTNVGILELRSAIARKLKKENGIDVDSRQEVIVTAGATQAIFALMYTLLDPGDEVLLPTPIFTAYKYCAALAGGSPIEVPMSKEEGFSLNVQRLKTSLTKRSKVLVLNSPCNPTGAVFSRKLIMEACEFAVENGLYVISDEIYEKFLYDNAKHFSPASIEEFKDKIITINGFSKTFAMTGWRIGYAAANPDIIRALTMLNMYNAVCASSFVQVAAVEALEHSQTFFQPILARFDSRRKRISKGLSDLGLEFSNPGGAFYIFPALNGVNIDSVSFCKELLITHSVSSAPGSSFGEAGEGHIRLCYAVNEDKLDIAMTKLGNYLERLRNDSAKVSVKKISEKHRGRMARKYAL